MTAATPLSQEAMEGLNPGIRHLVGALRDAGFDTYNSGDGCTYECTCDVHFPFVAIRCEPSELAPRADELLSFMQSQGIVFEEDDPHAPEKTEGKPWIEVRYEPLTKDAAVILCGVTDKDLPVAA